MSVTRRGLIAALVTLPWVPRWALAAVVKSTRVWPATEYTRVTFEAPQSIGHTWFFVKEPERLVVDLNESDLTPELLNLAEKIGAGDPYIQKVRVGRNKPGVVRVVFDLKTAVKPRVFSLAPVANYGHRLVMDIYPAEPPDPLKALLDDLERAERSRQMTGGQAPDGLRELMESLAAAKAPAKPDGKASATADAKADPKAPGKGSPAQADAKGAGKAPPAVKPKQRFVIVAIDPGHGGEDPGAIGRRGTREKDVTLAIARRLKARIDQEPNMRAVLTRDSDFFVPLAERVNKARRVQADLLVSIHADAFVSPEARGASVFALSERGASSTSAKWLANKENQADQIGGVDLALTRDRQTAQALLDLSLSSTIRDSVKLGQAVLREIGGVNRLHKANVEQAGFAVLKAPDIPSILVETAFISNPEEEKRLASRAYQTEVADAIVKGLKGYLAANPPLVNRRVA